jgi:tRNA 2-thiouridine synthesizing protein E
MPVVEFKGRKFEVDEDGFLAGGIDVWCPEWVEYVKDQEGISEVNEDHWRCIRYLQDYYKQNGIAPMIRVFCKAVNLKLKQIYELFPSGPAKGACKMAGLPKPTGCV